MIEGFNSSYGICATCNPVRYNRKSEMEVEASPQGKYTMAEPLPYVDRPSAFLRCMKTGRGAVFDPSEVGVWGIVSFRTYKGLHPSENNGVMSIVVPNLLVRAWHVLVQKMRTR